MDQSRIFAFAIAGLVAFLLASPVTVGASPTPQQKVTAASASFGKEIASWLSLHFPSTSKGLREIFSGNALAELLAELKAIMPT